MEASEVNTILYRPFGYSLTSPPIGVRLTHIDTGISVEVGDRRSVMANRFEAHRRLQIRIKMHNLKLKIQESEFYVMSESKS